MAVDIYNTKSNTLLSGTGGKDTIKNGGYWSGDWHDGGSNVTIDGDAGNDSIETHWDTKKVTIFGGIGDDSISNSSEKAKIFGGRGNDYIFNSPMSTNVTISGDAGNDYILCDSRKCSISGGEGKDTLEVCVVPEEDEDYSGLDSGYLITVTGDADDDVILFYYDDSVITNLKNIASTKNVVKYSNGDGKDTIYGFGKKDTLQIAGSYSTSRSGSDLMVYVGDGSIKLKNTSTANIVTISGGNDDGGGDSETNSWKISGTTATYGTSSKTLVTVKGVKSVDGLSLSGKVVTVANSSLNNSKVTISGSGYTLKLADDVAQPSSSTSAGFTVGGTTATYKTAGTSAGYTLSSDKKTVSYTVASGNKTLFTVSGLKSGTSANNLSLSGSTVTLKAAALGTSKVTISGSGYTLKFADDVSSPSTKKAAWSYANSTATYKSSYKTAGYSLASDGKSISYTGATSAKTLATIKGAKSKSGLSLSGKKITLKNSALTKKVTVSGSYEFDFLSGYKNATISGTSKADTITARGSNISIFGGKGKDSIKMVGSNQTVSGGDGADIFIYAASGGKEKITDFSTNDTLKISAEGDGTYSTQTSGSDVIVTIGTGEVTLVGAASKSLHIAGTINNTQSSSTKGVKVSSNGKKITLTSNYEEESFSLTGKYSSAVTLDASAALLDLNLTGNKFSNNIVGSAQDDTIDGDAGADTIYGGNGNDSIFGGTGNDELHGGIGDDTLWGGAGNDELYGDDGKDTFYYNTGDGNDTIYGYESGVDKIILASGSIDNVAADDNNNVIFTIGTGQIVVNQLKDRTIQIVDSSGNQVKNGLWSR